MKLRELEQMLNQLLGDVQKMKEDIIFLKRVSAGSGSTIRVVGDNQTSPYKSTFCGSQ